MDKLRLLKPKGLVVVDSKVGTRIKHLRNKRGWTQKELAKRSGINNSVLSRIEDNKRPVDSEELKKFAELFEVSTDYLSGYAKSILPSGETQEYVEIIDLAEETAIEQIKQQFSYDGNEITTEQAKKIYYFSLGVVQKE